LLGKSCLTRMPSDKRYDFFLSRRGSVAAVAREVADVLTEKGRSLLKVDPTSAV
jgi:hypothetical protein